MKSQHSPKNILQAPNQDESANDSTNQASKVQDSQQTGLVTDGIICQEVTLMEEKPDKKIDTQSNNSVEMTLSAREIEK